MQEEAPFSLDILPSAMMDIVRTQYFYDSLEYGLGSVFRDYIVGEVDKLADDAGVDEKRLGYFFRPEKRFHQAIYYKMSGTTVTVWRILDMRFDPRRIFAALRETSGE